MEIWLPYGSTEIVLDIKVENLLDNISYQPKRIDDDLREIIDNIDSHVNICLLDDNKILADLAVKIRNTLSLHGITSALYMPDRLKGIYKEYNIRALDASIFAKNDTVLLARASYDPLFGYDGVPAKIIRRNRELMKDIVKSARRPLPGRDTDALSIAYKHMESFESRSIEVIMDNNIIDMVIDEPIKANHRIRDKLARVKSERCRAIIIGSGYTHTLAESLRALWNCIDVVRDEGNIILLAEGSKGLGSEALDTLVQSKIDGYADGIEDLAFINWAKARYNIALITSLPDYYIKMIGFKAFRSINHALKYLINKNPRQKITIVQDATNVILE